MIDYVEIAEIAKTTIDENGRDVTFIRFDQSESDVNKPWLGPTDPRATPDATATVKGIFVQPVAAAELGLTTIDQDLLKRTSEILIVAPGATAPPFDLATANEIVDEGVNKKIVFVETLRPNTLTLLYFVGVSR